MPSDVGSCPWRCPVATTTDRALAGLKLCRLENGQAWGDTAEAYQISNAAAILDVDNAVKQTWIELPRGARKTTDLAALLLMILKYQAPSMARIYVGASDLEQAQELIDAAQGIIARTPELAGLYQVRDLEISLLSSGASFRALSGDLSAMGKRAYLIVLDEVCNWPQTRRAKKFWSVLISGNRKISECRTIVITNSGEPGSWQWKRREIARESEHWRFHSTPGPLPWLTPSDLESLRQNAITDSEYQRLHMNVWMESEDRLASPADLRACTTLPGELPPVPGRTYLAALDVGVVNDASVIVVAHREDLSDGSRRVVLDAIRRWKGTRRDPVPLAEVAAELLALHQAYGGARVVLDPHQAVLIAQQLADRGVDVTQHAFTSSSVGRLALALHGAIKNHRLALPDDEDLLSELASVRLVKNSVGSYRLDHESSGHDDQAVALALAVQHLIDGDPTPEFIIFDTPDRPAALLPAGPGGMFAMRATTSLPEDWPAPEPEWLAAEPAIAGLNWLK